MNLYEWPSPNPAPKPTRHWGLDKSYKIVQMRSYEFVRISHLVKYVRIGREIALFFFIIIYIKIFVNNACANNIIVNVIIIAQTPAGLQ